MFTAAPANLKRIDHTASNFDDHTKYCRSSWCVCVCVCDRICLDIPIMGIVIVLVTGRKSSLNKFKQS